MRLSETFLYEGEKILSDGEFEKFGLLNCDTDKSILSYLESEEFLKLAQNRCISCIICKKELVGMLPKHIAGVLVSDQPRLSYWRRHNELQERRKSFPTQIGKDCNIHPQAAIAQTNVIIGNHVVIEEFVSIKENTIIGDHCIIRAGCIIGSQGFEFKAAKEGHLFAVEHFGGVVIGNDVELQGLTHVAKAVDPLDDTVIGQGSKTDGLVHIAHADKIGDYCRIAAGAVISGSVCMGNNVWIGPNATISNGIRIGDGARISLGSVVTKNVEKGKTVSGNFAIDHKIFLENIKMIADR